MLDPMTDTHCHLDFCEDPENAADPNLSAIVSIGTTLERCKRTLQLAEQFSNVWAALGIHPNDVDEAAEPLIREQIEELAAHPKVVAIGETGVDTYWDKHPVELQRESFQWQADLARRLNKPLILHVRDKKDQEDASLEAIDLITEAAHPKGILHCFNGHEGLLEAGLGLGWMVSFAGNLTYKNAKAIHAAAKRVPSERLLLETDSPYLTPQAKRGERNVPANVRLTAQFLAELRGESLVSIEEVTDENAKRVYGLP